MRLSHFIRYLLAFIFLCAPAASWAASVTLRWDANTEPDIASYNLYYGTASRTYGLPLPAGNTTSYTVDNLDEGRTYYFALTALDTSGNESGYSSEITANATSTEPATGAYTLLLSYNSDRSNAVELSQQIISGSVYIYLNPEAYVSQVVFSIDGVPHNTENYAPYDIGEPFDTTSLSNGSHNISALIRLQDGSTQSINANCTVSNDVVSPEIPSNAISLPSTGWLGFIPGGDQSHSDKVTFTFPAMSGDVILKYEVWDIDINNEVHVALNGNPIAYVPVTPNNQWGGLKTLRLPDSAVSDSQENILVFNATYNPPNNYYWGVRKVSVDEATTASQEIPADAISLPSTGWLGLIPGGDQSHSDNVTFTFPAMSGDVTLQYEVWDIDSNDEVQVVLNGNPVAYVPVTPNNQWGGLKTLQLPDSVVSDSQENILVFNATKNPPNNWYWGVRKVDVN